MVGRTRRRVVRSSLRLSLGLLDCVRCVRRLLMCCSSRTELWAAGSRVRLQRTHELDRFMVEPGSGFPGLHASACVDTAAMPACLAVQLHVELRDP